MSFYLNKLSKLASLPVKENEKISKDLEEISTHFEILKNIDTDEVGPLYQVNGLKNVYRDDNIIETPPIKNGYFTTTAVINKNG